MPPNGESGSRCSASQARLRGGRSGASVRKPAPEAERETRDAVVTSGAKNPGVCIAGAATMPQAAEPVQLPIDDFDEWSPVAMVPQSGRAGRALAGSIEPELAIMPWLVAE